MLEAFKTVDGVEVDSIDPLTSFEFYRDVFYVVTPFGRYEYPLSDFNLWGVREKEQSFVNRRPSSRADANMAMMTEALEGGKESEAANG